MIEEFINSFPSEAAFCRAIGMKQQFYTQIKKGLRPWPPSAARAIEFVSKGAIGRHVVRPDIYPNPTDVMPVVDSTVSKVSDHAPA